MLFCTTGFPKASCIGKNVASIWHNRGYMLVSYHNNICQIFFRWEFCEQRERYIYMYISMAQCKTTVTPLLTQWTYYSVVLLRHRYILHNIFCFQYAWCPRELYMFRIYLT